MRDSSYLQGGLRIAGKLIDRHLAGTRQPYSEVSKLGAWLNILVGAYRTRAVHGFLLEGDPDGFIDDVSRAARTAITLFRSFAAGYDVDQSLHGAFRGNYSPVLYAMAAGDFAIAAELNEVMPIEPFELEDPRAVALAEILRGFSSDDGDRVSVGLEAFRENAEEFGDEERVKMFEALAARSAEDFNAGLSAYLESFEDVDPEAVGLDSGEEFLSVEALALVKLAVRIGIAVTVEHRLIPGVLVRAPSQEPDGGYPAWVE